MFKYGIERDGVSRSIYVADTGQTGQGTFASRLKSKKFVQPPLCFDASFITKSDYTFCGSLVKVWFLAIAILVCEAYNVILI